MAKPAHHHTLKTLSLALATTATLALAPASAAISAPLQPIDLASQHANVTSDVVNVAVVVRRGAGVGPRGNAYRYRSTTVVRPGGPRGARRSRRGAARGGASLGASRLVSLGTGRRDRSRCRARLRRRRCRLAYGSPPAPGMCWYYTDMTRTQGFWDYCPQ